MSKKNLRMFKIESCEFEICIQKFRKNKAASSWSKMRVQMTDLRFESSSLPCVNALTVEKKLLLYNGFKKRLWEKENNI